MTLFLRPAISPFPILSSISIKMAKKVSVSSPSQTRKLPILLFDVMDTLVRDPFYQDVPAFFGMSMKVLLEIKHPTAWIEFEEGLIDEKELEMKFFKDGRPFDLEGLKACMKKGYRYLDGIESLLHRLKRNCNEIHAFTNYPFWYKMIEEKLKLSAYLSWTYCSCNSGKRKPAPEAYNAVLQHLGVEPSSCIFVDDRLVNVEAAITAGMVGIHFKSAGSLEKNLSLLGVETRIRGETEDEDLNPTLQTKEQPL
ncbi:flavin mononucleotide hydrolase 1, chloroplatic-like [Aristolochia californica]|uniref:flavin mononucleotide hydrolase 1, chloroplatic-like n=1 Tax=Aristolochia californica TaxID=171875 RepID=UPI0035E064F3